MADDTEEKNLPPSQRKLQKAREKGQVMASSDFVAALITLIGVLFVIASLGQYYEIVAQVFRLAIDQMGRTRGPMLGASLSSVMNAVIYGMLPLLALVTMVGIAANIAHKKGLVVSFEPLKPDLKRISPGAGLKRVFGSRNAIEFGIALVRSTIWFVLAGILIWSALPSVLNTATCGFGCVWQEARDETWRLLIIGLILLIIAAFIDLPVQHFLFLKEMKMSRQEFKRELRETEGSPEFEGARRGEHREMVQGSGGIKRSSFVVVSSNAAVALRYDEKDAPVPVVVASGRGRNADRIVEAAQKVGTPVLEDPDVANALIGTEVGQIIARELFNPVALLLLKARMAQRAMSVLK